MLVLGVTQSPFGVIVLLVMIYLLVSSWFDRRAADRKQFPMVITSDVEAARAEFENGQFFSRRNVRKIIVRENRNRHADDSELVQIYMELKDSDYLVLLYQQYPSREATKKTEEIAEQLRTWLKAGR